ncbi:MAG: hypothetical protein KDA35_09280, partial [Hyphomonadaceae bacterium]|nr:hypothetical protein [Hyphomonadaceae bacterium]
MVVVPCSLFTEKRGDIERNAPLPDIVMARARKQKGGAFAPPFALADCLVAGLEVHAAHAAHAAAWHAAA